MGLCLDVQLHAGAFWKVTIDSRKVGIYTRPCAHKNRGLVSCRVDGHPYLVVEMNRQKYCNASLMPSGRRSKCEESAKDDREVDLFPEEGTGRFPIAQSEGISSKRNPSTFGESVEGFVSGVCSTTFRKELDANLRRALSIIRLVRKAMLKGIDPGFWPGKFIKSWHFEGYILTIIDVWPAIFPCERSKESFTSKLWLAGTVCWVLRSCFSLAQGIAQTNHLLVARKTAHQSPFGVFTMSACPVESTGFDRLPFEDGYR
jgi:hypothetical protein